jgi:quercetin dioxygenase-like cupin family protein
MRIMRDRDVLTAQASSANFTGRVWRTDYLEPADADALAGSRFTYEPGARSYWHLHEHEQAIIAVFGSGVVAWEGQDTPQRLGVGDWWHVEPGVPHWHGATARTAFAHLAVTAGGRTFWLHEVADEDYLRASTS